MESTDQKKKTTGEHLVHLDVHWTQLVNHVFHYDKNKNKTMDEMLKSTDSCTNSTHAQKTVPTPGCQHSGCAARAQCETDTTLMPVHRRLLGLSAFFRRVWAPSSALELHFKYREWGGGHAYLKRLSCNMSLDF